MDLVMIDDITLQMFFILSLLGVQLGLNTAYFCSIERKLNKLMETIHDEEE